MSYHIIKFAPGCQNYFVFYANCVIFLFPYRIKHCIKSAKYKINDYTWGVVTTESLLQNQIYIWMVLKTEIYSRPGWRIVNDYCNSHK